MTRSLEVGGGVEGFMFACESSLPFRRGGSDQTGFLAPFDSSPEPAAAMLEAELTIGRGALACRGATERDGSAWGGGKAEPIPSRLRSGSAAGRARLPLTSQVDGVQFSAPSTCGR